MLEGDRRSSAWVVSSPLTFAVGLTFVATGVESLADFDACVSNPACLPDASALSVRAFFAILAAGIVMAVVATWVLAIEWKVTRTVSTWSTTRATPVLHARFARGSPPRRAETLARDGRKAARFYARLGVIERQFRSGVSSERFAAADGKIPFPRGFLRTPSGSVEPLRLVRLLWQPNGR